MIIYSKNDDTHNAALGYIETPVKMIIEHESDLLKKKGGICDALFNIESSKRFGETIVGGNEFSAFLAVPEGEAAPQDNTVETFNKFIEHIQFMKEFVISAEMMEDANYGIAADAKHRAENFVRAYYKTINKICEQVLIDGTKYSTKYGAQDIDLTAGDSLPLFSSQHRWGGYFDGSGTQSNYFFGSIFSKGEDDSIASACETFEESLYTLASKLRNMKDERGEALGYTADTIIIPGNNPRLESVVKKVCGSYGSTNGNYNEINLHYGNWNVVVLPSWQPTDKRIMLMSSEANKNLQGNMFFNRVPLTVTNWVDNHTGNYIWNGRCRFGVGFGNYKHILLAVDSQDEVDGATSLED